MPSISCVLLLVYSILRREEENFSSHGAWQKVDRWETAWERGGGERGGRGGAVRDCFEYLYSGVWSEAGFCRALYWRMTQKPPGTRMVNQSDCGHPRELAYPRTGTGCLCSKLLHIVYKFGHHGGEDHWIHMSLRHPPLRGMCDLQLSAFVPSTSNFGQPRESLDMRT